MHFYTLALNDKFLEHPLLKVMQEHSEERKDSWGQEKRSKRESLTMAQAASQIEDDHFKAETCFKAVAREFNN